MKTMTNTPRLYKYCLVALAGLSLPMASTPSFAQLNRTQEFQAVDAAQDASDEVVEETVIVREAPRRKVIRRVVREEAPINETTVVPVNAPTVAEAAPQNTTGDRIGQMINGKLDQKRRVREEELRRQQKAEEDQLISRIGNALDDNRSDAPPVAAPVQQYPQEYAQPVQPTTSGRRPPMVYSTTTDPMSGSVMAEAETNSPPKGNFTLSPNFGGAFMSNKVYDIDTGTAVGFTADIGIDDNLALNVGYTYAKFDIGLAQGGQAFNGFNNYYQTQFSYNNYLTNNNTNRLEYIQNIIDLGIKYKLFDSSSRFRPYLGGGAAYSKGFLNYSQQLLNSTQGNAFNYNNGALQDYEISSWAAYVQLGMLLNFSDMFGIGLNYKYFKVLSYSEERRINNYAFVGNNFGLGAAPTEKDFVSGSLAGEDFHTLNLSLNLTF
jgi:hypothetical protein